MDLNMTKLPTRESPPQVNEEQLPRHRNVYDYGGEYEFPSAQHWTAPSVKLLILCKNRERRIQGSLSPYGRRSQRQRRLLSLLRLDSTAR